jgi:hypothetical protein
MSVTLLAFYGGLILGGVIGMFLMALLVMSREPKRDSTDV